MDWPAWINAAASVVNATMVIALAAITYEYMKATKAMLAVMSDEREDRRREAVRPVTDLLAEVERLLTVAERSLTATEIDPDLEHLNSDWDHCRRRVTPTAESYRDRSPQLSRSLFALDQPLNQSGQVHHFWQSQDSLDLHAPAVHQNVRGWSTLSCPSVLRAPS